ncbi:MAG TPA: FRG domain-containing protein [Parafilimonas sp.]|nr:FRG domain-containing protein [Parafilimonas sp.]
MPAAKKAAHKHVTVKRKPAKKKIPADKKNYKDGTVFLDSDKIKPVKSLSDYISILETCCSTDNVLFRGQNADWPLLPKLCRINPRKDKDEELKEALLLTEKKMLEDFKRLSKPHLNKTPANNWEWIALAQHHGLPTRLLDWSSNPLAALWFTVCAPASTKGGVIWIFFPEKDAFLTPNEIANTDPFDVVTARVFQPQLSTIRIQSQSGWFTTQQFKTTDTRFIPFDEITDYENKLLKIQIPAAYFSELRSKLDYLGVNRFTLFQDLDGIAGYVEWFHSFFSDEETDPDKILKKITG